MNDIALRGMRALLAGAVLLLSLCVPSNLTLAMQAGAPASSPSAVAARVVLESANGERQSRALEGFDTTDPRMLGARLVRYEGLAPLPSSASIKPSAQVELSNGDRLYGRIKSGLGEHFDIELAGGVLVAVAIDELASLVIPSNVPDSWTAPLEAPKEGDRIYRKQGDKLDPDNGGIEEFTPEGIRFHGRVGSKLTQWSELAGVFVESLEKAPAAGATASEGVPVVIDLIDHSRIRGSLQRLSAEGCRVSMRHGEKLFFPAAAVAGVLVDDGALIYLSTLAPTTVLDSSPFGDDLGMRWPHRVDRSVAGAPLSAGGRVRWRGIGVHAPSKLSWKLDGRWKELRGTCAVDDETLRLSARGSVVFRILLDGKKVWESPVLHGGDAPASFHLTELAAAGELTCEVDEADHSYVADRADWLDVLLVR